MIKNYTLALLIVLFFVWGCKKGDTSNPTTGQTHLIKGLKTTSNGTVTDTLAYSYDSSNRIIETTENSGGTLYDTKFTYDSNDRITEADVYTNSQISQKSTFSYNNGSATEQSTIYLNNNVTLINQTLTLNSDQHITKSATDANNYSIYAYDASGNVTSIVQYVSSTGTTIYSATYDNHNSIYLNIKGNYFIWYAKYSPYNIISQNSTYISGTFSDTFDLNGYLTSKRFTATGASSSVVVTTYTYINK